MIALGCMAFYPSKYAITGYVNAGGRGTRLNAIFESDPKIGISKALLRVGKPLVTLIDHQINKLLAAGVDNVVVGAGDHEVVARYIAQAYAEVGNVRAICADDQLGNGGDLVNAVRNYPELFGPSVIIVNVDTILDWSEFSVLDIHMQSKAKLTINLTLNNGVPNEGAFCVGYDGRVLYSQESSKNVLTIEQAEPQMAYSASSTGALIVTTQFLIDIDWRASDGSLSLYSGVVGAALETESLYAYDNEHRFFKDVGTVTAWKEVQNNPEIIAPYLHYPVEQHM